VACALYEGELKSSSLKNAFGKNLWSKTGLVSSVTSMLVASFQNLCVISNSWIKGALYCMLVSCWISYLLLNLQLASCFFLCGHISENCASQSICLILGGSLARELADLLRDVGFYQFRLDAFGSGWRRRIFWRLSSAADLGRTRWSYFVTFEAIVGVSSGRIDICGVCLPW
jgi:hypothetical protein